MSGGGTRTYKHSLIPWGGRMRSSLKLPKGTNECLNCHIKQEGKLYNIQIFYVEIGCSIIEL